MIEPKITIIQDSREQRPLKFTHKYVKAVKVQKLVVGDYAAETEDGFRFPIYFERKSLNDFYGTLTQGYDRFRDEMKRAKERNIRLIIIIEASLSRIKLGFSFGNRTPESLLYQIFYINAKYEIETVYCCDAKEAALYIEMVFIATCKLHLALKQI